MSDIFQEVDEDLKYDKMAGWWKKYGSSVITFAVGIVLGTAIYVAVDQYQTQKYEQQTEKLINLTQDISSDAPEAAKIDALVAYAVEIGGDKGALALLKAAEVLRDLGDNAKAIKTYETVNTLGNIDVFYKDLASLMTVQMQIDTLSAEEIQTKLKPLAEEGRPLRYTAEELLAYILMSKGDYKNAQAMFKSLSVDVDAPQALQQRAAALATIEPAAGADEEKTPKEEDTAKKK